MNDTIDRFYSAASDFNDSISLICILLIVNNKTDMPFPKLKEHITSLKFDNQMIDDIEEIALHVESRELGRLIRLLSPIDLLFIRERPRNIPRVITAGREMMRKKGKK